MAKGYPSMTALLALLAVAGYQNRDKIGEMLSGNRKGLAEDPRARPGDPRSTASPNDGNDIFGNLREAATGVGGFLSNGLRELVEHFQQRGGGEAARSWVDRGPNQPVAPHQLQEIIGADVLMELSRRTGLSEQEVVNRLSQRLPSAIDQYTPEGRLPT